MHTQEDQGKEENEPNTFYDNADVKGTVYYVLYATKRWIEAVEKDLQELVIQDWKQKTRNKKEWKKNRPEVQWPTMFIGYKESSSQINEFGRYGNSRSFPKCYQSSKDNGRGV